MQPQKVRPVQIRFRPEDYSALEHWANSQSLSITEAVSLAVRKLIGIGDPHSPAPVSARGLLRNTAVMEDMTEERRRELSKDAR